jgi:4-hydroxy-tetrahydrodipicolinate synthase
MLSADTRRPFGQLLTAMVTPFTPSGAVDLSRARQLASHLVDVQLNDGLVVNGTTGESPTTSDAEKADLVAAVVEAVGGRCHVIAGVGSPDTAHTVALAEQAAKAGAHGVLVVTPYYSRPPQSGLIRHFRQVADSTDLPVMVYDIPARTATAIQTDTMITLAGHERIVAVKDAKGDVTASSRVIAETDLAYYSGDDALTLPLLSVGGVGVVGTSTHFTGALTKDLIAAFERGDVYAARVLHQRLLPVYTGVFRTQGVILVKAGLRLTGLDVGGVRLPMVEATSAEVEQFRADLAAAGLA